MFSSWHYRAYGLHWVCDFELPELSVWPHPSGVSGDSPDQSAPDIEIVLGQTLAPDAVERAAATGQALEFGACRSQLLFQVARFTISDGRRVEVEPAPGYNPDAWRVPLLGSVLAALLEQRGLFVLHAGALCFPGGAAAFLGDKGQGKSTLNAALSQAGFPLLSDDVVALQMPGRAPMALHAADATTEGATSNAPLAEAPLAEAPLAEVPLPEAPLAKGPLALCGFSQIKLSPHSLRAVTGQEAAAWPGVAPGLQGMDKRSFRAPLALEAQPLRALFVLHSAPETEGPGEVQLRPLNVQQALAQLIPHTFGARFGQSYLRGERQKTHFLDCARLVNSCAVWELSRPRDLTLLPATVERIAREMGA